MPYELRDLPQCISDRIINMPERLQAYVLRELNEGLKGQSLVPDILVESEAFSGFNWKITRAGYDFWFNVSKYNYNKAMGIYEVSNDIKSDGSVLYIQGDGVETPYCIDTIPKRYKTSVMCIPEGLRDIVLKEFNEGLNGQVLNFDAPHLSRSFLWDLTRLGSKFWSRVFNGEYDAAAEQYLGVLSDDEPKAYEDSCIERILRVCADVIRIRKRNGHVTVWYDEFDSEKSFTSSIDPWPHLESSEWEA